MTSKIIVEEITLERFGGWTIVKSLCIALPRFDAVETWMDANNLAEEHG